MDETLAISTNLFTPYKIIIYYRSRIKAQCIIFNPNDPDLIGLADLKDIFDNKFFPDTYCNFKKDVLNNPYTRELEKNAKKIILTKFEEYFPESLKLLIALKEEDLL